MKQMYDPSLGLVPLSNFGNVDKGIYRSSQPYYQYQYEWLFDTLQVSRIYNLRAESNHDSRLVSECKLPIEVIKIDVTDHQPPSDAQAKEFIKSIQYAKEDENVLIHCEHGQGRTSTFSVLSKVAMGWDIEEALNDEKERFHYSFRHYAQEDWIRNFLKNNDLT